MTRSRSEARRHTIMSSVSSEEEEFHDGDEEDEAFEEESSDDEPLSNLKVDHTNDTDTATPGSDRKRSASSRKSSSVSYKELDESDDDGDESSDDDDDDIPLSSLVAKKPTPKTNGTTKKKASAASKSKKKDPPPKKKKKTVKKAPPKKKSSTVSSSSAAAAAANSNGGSKSYEWASAALYGTKCDKGLLIQRLLCRWWYAFQWPDPATLPAKPPKNFDSLDGFPGVYIGTAAENVGQIHDVRNQGEAPSFHNFAKKTAEELRDLLVTAIQEQTKQLVAAEGSGTPTEKELQKLLKWANKLNVNKAEKEAAKVLKSQGLRLPSPSS